MKKMVISIMAVLVLLITVLLYLDRDRAGEMADSAQNARFVIKSSGAVLNTLGMNDIRSAGEESFKAVLKTSGKDPVYLNYKGCQLKELLKSKNIDTAGKTMIVIKAADGFSIAYSIEEVMTDKNIYIAYEEEGELLKSASEGGRGPYQAIVVSDQFSNRRCKHAVEADLR
ncbi:MAG TPA: hypothetical protein PLK90_02100 [Clostridiales bacterium]|nr:hypothetical protein [Clostridiales bacterium]HQP69169.1 hypothetical protein [Clostridiales bacterium]